MKIGWIGCGAMGKGLALRLAENGYETMLLRHTPSKKTPEEFLGDDAIAAMIRMGAQVTPCRRELFETCDLLGMCLTRFEDTEEALLGPEGLLATANARVRLVIDFSTSLPESTRKIDTALKERGVELLDAPLGGGPEQAREGTLSITVGGERDVYAENIGLFQALCKNVTYAGPSGSGHAVKLMNNALAIMNWTFASEMFLYAKEQHISQEALYAFVSGSGANSKGFQRQAGLIQRGSYPLAFALAYAAKDASYAARMMRESPANFVNLDSFSNLLARARDAGYAFEDVGAVYQYMEKEREALTEDIRRHCQ